MIWNSVVLMTVIDVLIVGMTVFTWFIYFRHRTTLDRLDLTTGMVISLTGLTIIGLFYLADLATMFVLPSFMPMKTAMAVMRDLHLNYMWLVSLVGVGLIVSGVVYRMKVLLPKLEGVFIDLGKEKDKAESANIAKSEFLSQMSHELRTPLNAIVGFAQFLDTGPKKNLSLQQKESIQEILMSGWHLNELVNELLDLSSIESGKLSLCIESHQIYPIIEDCLKIVTPMAEKREITIEDKTTDQVVQGDSTRLKQVLLNLLSNAVKYNIYGGHITIHSEKKGDKRMRLFVSDTGPGLDEESIGKLFLPFNRLGVEKQEIEGTGIGLTITKNLIEHMGGSIGVESSPGKGSSFWIELRLSEAPPLSEKEVPLASTEARATEGERKSVVLYVEDNISNIKLVTQILADRGDIIIHTAQTAELGLELARAHKPDVILLDIQLPGMDGYEMLKYLQENDETKKIPVLAVSANAMEQDIEKGLNAGFRRYLTKPINIKEFTGAIDLALRGNRDA